MRWKVDRWRPVNQLPDGQWARNGQADPSRVGEMSISRVQKSGPDTVEIDKTVAKQLQRCP